MREFEDHRVVVTGAAGVMGRWISSAFAQQGAAVLATDNREDDLAALADELRGHGGTVEVMAADLTSDDGVASLLAETERLWRSPTVLVNNAGVYPHGAISDTGVEEVRGIFEINVMAPYALSRGVALQMSDAGVEGAIVNIGSGAGNAPATGGAAYAASKAALHMMTRAFALELAPLGIRVNTVQPGFAPGSQVSHLDEDYVARMTSTIPLGRTSGPRDASEAVMFLCSSRASFITGATLAVDGGRTAGTVRPMPSRTVGSS
jgi:3-oxoacyl-[acyl-carrier protein] reductase